MTWKSSFEKAIKAFENGCYQEALRSCTDAVEKSARPTPYYLYDCRAAISEELGRYKDALRDAKAVIDLAPTRWQGYSRSARLFHLARKYDQCIAMSDMALSRLGSKDATRRMEITSLRATALADKRRVTCHIAKLPIELLAEIFQHVVAYDSPLVLKVAAICKHWREIVLAAPNLWQTLALTGRSPTRKTEIWLARSRGRIRALNLRLACLDPYWKKDMLDSMKWNHLRECRLEDWDVITSLDEDIRNQVIQNLEVLEIHDKLFGEARNDILHYPYASLHTLTLEGAIFGDLPTAPPTLRHFSVKNSTSQPIENMHHFLSSASEIETLLLDTPFSDVPSVISPDAPIPILPNLTSISISAFPGSLRLFFLLSLPRLRELTLKCSPRPIDSVLESLTTTELTNFTLESCVVNASSIVALVKASPQLEALALRKLPNDVANPVLETIAAQPGSCLKYLDVTGCADVSTGALMRLVKARLASMREKKEEEEEAENGPQLYALDSVKANGCQLIDGEYLPWFRERVKKFECVYMTRKESRHARR